jgi:hypothetical protein
MALVGQNCEARNVYVLNPLSICNSARRLRDRLHVGVLRLGGAAVSAPDPDPTMDAMLTAMGGYIERLLKAATLARESNFTAMEAAIRGDLEHAQRDLLLVLCTVPDGDPRRRVAAMVSKVAAVLGMGLAP